MLLWATLDVIRGGEGGFVGGFMEHLLETHSVSR